MRLLATLILSIGLTMSPLTSSALSIGHDPTQLYRQFEENLESDLQAAQGNGGKTLSEAIDQVRRQTNGRILSAETRISGNREVHYVKVLTQDGKVRTVKVPGRRLNR